MLSKNYPLRSFAFDARIKIAVRDSKSLQSSLNILPLPSIPFYSIVQYHDNIGNLIKNRRDRPTSRKISFTRRQSLVLRERNEKKRVNDGRKSVQRYRARNENEKQIYKTTVSMGNFERVRFHQESKWKENEGTRT